MKKTKISLSSLNNYFRKVKNKNTTYVKFVSGERGWIVIRGNEWMGKKKFGNKNDAIEYANIVAKKHKTELTIYSKTGSILSSSRFGNFVLEDAED